MNKIAIIVQRYSIDVNGGAETHARMLAEHLNGKYDIEVLTSCAKDYITWENHYQEGEENINGIKVLRFKSEKKDRKKNRKLSRYLRRNKRYLKEPITWKNFITLPFKKLIYRTRKNHSLLFDEWIKSQGPLCTGLVEYIKENKNKNSAFIFFTYLYYPTYVGIQYAGEKSILIPTAHDEVPFYLDGFSRLFSTPQFIMYNTLAEKELVEKTYPQTKRIKSDIAGVGFDKPNYSPSPTPLDSKYFLYIGRIDKNKGCKELIDYFTEYKKKTNHNIRLVLIGNNFMKEIKTDNNIIFTGFISDREKSGYIQHCEGLIIPSRFESLSMVTLEAMVMGKPVVATAKSEVLKNHIKISKAGFIYEDKQSFFSQLDKVLNISNDEKNQIAQNGMIYVKNNYNWATIIDKFEKTIKHIND